MSSTPPDSLPLREKTELEKFENIVRANFLASVHTAKPLEDCIKSIVKHHSATLKEKDELVHDKSLLLGYMRCNNDLTEFGQQYVDDQISKLSQESKERKEDE